jgi:integrase
MWESLEMIKITLRHAKNDKLRVGSTFWFRSLPPQPDSVNITRVLFDWAVRAKLRRGDVFMSHRDTVDGSSVVLKATWASAALKRSAREHGLDDRNYALHSPRIGGATTLRAADAPATMIQHLARHRSAASTLTYQEASLAEMDRMQRLLSGLHWFTETDLHVIEQDQRVRAAVPDELAFARQQQQQTSFS